jgi:endonuclease/exonuclease/phosphatase family metal-dependent hydrolase
VGRHGQDVTFGHLRAIIIAIAAFFATTGAVAQSRGGVSVGFWNVENLFDTVAGPFGRDAEFTPEGPNRWDTERYNAKIASLARVLDDMSLDVVGLAEVESRAAVADLVRACKTDYAFIHFTGGDSRGIEQALLYKGDKFFPDLPPGAGGRQGRGAKLIPAGAGREFLCVRGTLAGHRVDLIVVHLPSALNSLQTRRAAARSLAAFVDSLTSTDPGAMPIVMGDFNASSGERFMREELGTEERGGVPRLFSPLRKLEKSGAGSYVWDGRWRMYDNIFLSPAFLGGGGLRYDDCGIFVREYMLRPPGTRGRGAPLRTFSSGVWEGGASDHLPVWVSLRY